MLPPLPPPTEPIPPQPRVPGDDDVSPRPFDLVYHAADQPDEDEGEERKLLYKEEEEDKANILDTRTLNMISMNIDKLAGSKAPAISRLPAPPCLPPLGDPELPHPKAPIRAVVGVRRTMFEQFLNSSVGRSTLFVVTVIFTNMSIYGLIHWNAPEFRESGASFYYFFLALLVLLIMYTIPLAAESAGMSARETGWKPYLIVFRCAFVIAIPAITLQVLGRGTEVWFGEAAGKAGSQTIATLPNKYWNYFELADGFVGLNLTKGITETLHAEIHGVKGHRRKSRFRDAELRINKEPYTNIPEPTETPGRLATYRIAPIFAQWAPCTARYRISIRCLRENPVMAWAISVSTSICSRYKSVGCRAPKPTLEPIYRCSEAGGIKGVEHTLKITGLCGHVTRSPPAGVIDELGALLLYDAWPKLALPKADQLWIDVTPDECIGNVAQCKADWNNLFFAGLACQILANLCLMYTCWKDCKVDKKIREARHFMEVQEKEARLNKVLQEKAGAGGSV